MTKPYTKIIKRLRDRRGWTQLQLAQKIGVEQSTICRWERGDTQPTGLYLTSIDRLIASARRR